VNTVVVLAVECCFWPNTANTANCLRPCELERYHEEEISGILVCTARNKVMLIVFFDARDVVHFQFPPQGQSTSMCTKRHCSICSEQCKQEGQKCEKTVLDSSS